MTLSEPATSPVTVRYSIEPNGSADTNDVKPKSGVLTFKPNAKTGLTPTTKWLSTKVFPDVAVEGDESFRVVLSHPSDGHVLGRSEASGTIIDDDPGTGVRVSVGDASIVEGDTGTNGAPNKARVRVTLDRPATETVTVRVTLAGGTASAGGDFKAVTKTLTFKPGQWQKSMVVPIHADTEAGEGIETVLVRLSGPSVGLSISRAEGTVQILDDD